MSAPRTLEDDLLMRLPPRPSDDYPDLLAAWPLSSAVDAAPPFRLLAATFDALDKTRSRQLITGILAHLFRHLIVRASTALTSAVYLCVNRAVPAFVPFELGVGGQVFSGALADVTGRSSAQLRTDYHRLGDIGDVAYHARTQARSITSLFADAGTASTSRAILTIPGIHAALIELAGMRGTGAVQRRRARVRALLVLAQDTEMRWLVRTLASNLRVGAVEKTVVAALAHAFAPSSLGSAAVSGAAEAAANASVLAACYSRRPDYGHLVQALLAGGVAGAVAACQLTCGTPLVPMLGRITRYAVVSLFFLCVWRRRRKRGMREHVSAVHTEIAVCVCERDTDRGGAAGAQPRSLPSIAVLFCVGLANSVCE